MGGKWINWTITCLDIVCAIGVIGQFMQEPCCTRMVPYEYESTLSDPLEKFLSTRNMDMFTLDLILIKDMQGTN